MKYMNMILATVLVGIVAVNAAQDTTLSQAEVRDPRVLERILEANATDVETRVAAVEGAAQTAGAKAGATVTATEDNSFVNKTVLTLADTPVSVVYLGSTTNAIGSTKIYDFPAGRILVLGVTVDSFDITDFPTNTMDAADGGDFSFGTADPGADAVLNDTAADFLASTSIDPITNVVSGALAASAQFDGTTTPKDLYVNLTIDNGDLTGASTNAITVDAAVTIHWINLGDY